MRFCFRIHPDDYDKKANEEFYENMASKGWLLKKRWANLSKFEKTEPQKLKFDIYYSEYNYVSDKEKAEFRASGRTVADIRSNVHVSYACASEHLPPVIKSNEDAAKAIIPLKNNRSVIPYPLVLIFMISLLNNIRIKFTYNAFESLPFLEDRLYKIITMPELYIAMIIVVAYIIFLAVYEHVRWKKAVSAFYKDENPDDGIRKKVLYIFSIVMTGLSVVFIALFSFGNIGNTEQEIPEFSDGLYLDVHDFGIKDKITDTGLYVDDDYFPCKMTHRKTISAQMWLTQEYYYINDTRIIIYQDVIEYKSPETALYAAELLASDKNKNYSEYAADGFEKVYSSAECFIAVIDNTVYRVTIITEDENIVPTTEKLLDIILSKNLSV